MTAVRTWIVAIAFARLAAGCGGGPATTITPTFTLVTSAPGAYWKTDTQVTQMTGGGAVDVTVNDTSTAQTWEGFGGAFNEMGWSYLSMLSASDRDTAIRLLFGADGARLAFGRIPIGASDYAMEPLHARRDRRRHVVGELLHRPRPGQPHPVHQGGPGRRRATSVSGQARGRRRRG